MKKINSFIVASLAVIALIATACNSEDAKKDAPAGKAKAAKTEVNLPNYRYVDLDSVLSKYNLAKDYNEEMLRMQTNMESAAKRHENKIQNFAATMQNKMQNNGYLSEASYNADVAELNKKQQNAQNYLGSLQAKAQQEALRQQQEFLDSLNNCLADYNRTRHYDAILLYTPGELFNPALDITDDIINGLNSRYTRAGVKPEKETK